MVGLIATPGTDTDPGDSIHTSALCSTTDNPPGDNMRLIDKLLVTNDINNDILKPKH